MFFRPNARRVVWVAILAVCAVVLTLRLSRRADVADETGRDEKERSSLTAVESAMSAGESSAPVVALPVAPATVVPTKLSPAQVALRERRNQSPGAATGRPWEQVAGWQALSDRDRIIELIGRPFVIQADGGLVYLELALDEIYLPQNEEGERLQKLPPQPDARALIAEVEKMHQPGELMPQLVFYIPGKERGKESRRVLTEQVITESANVEASLAHARAAGFADSVEFEPVPGFVLTRADAVPGQALLAVAALSDHAASLSVEPVLNREMSKKLLPNDPLFARQWHLRNTGQSGGTAGVDAKVVNTWDTRRGSGIKLAVIDDGVQHDHPDLVGNYQASLSTDYVGNDSNPYPNLTTDDHGTAVAGVIAATQGNALGVSGAAPLSNFAAYRLLGSNQSPTTESQAFAKDNNIVHIKNNSWGPPDEPNALGTIAALPRNALQNAATSGRSGLGSIIVFAAGNGREWGDQGNKDAYANSIYTFSIGAVTNTGALSWYSETGAQLIAVAPSNGGSLGIVTTDLMGDNGYNKATTPVPKDYAHDFGGTSSAAPLASGVIALILEANPGLGWRDVKEILLRSGTKLSPTSTGWVSRYGGKSSLPPIKHHHSFGGGMVNAEAAVAMAAGWTNLPAQVSQTRSDGSSRPIPDNNSTGVTVNLDFSSIPPMRLEMVSVTVNIVHPYKGDLNISLVSPTGVTSALATVTGADDASNYTNWTFTSNRHWGDRGAGIWKLLVRDAAAGDVGVLNSVNVTLYGTPNQPADATLDPVTQLLPTGGPATFTTTGTGDGDLLYQWYKNTTSVITGATSATFTIPSLALSHAGRYSCEVSNVTGADRTAEALLGVVDATPATQVLAENAKVTLQAKAQAPTTSTVLSYRWYRGMTLLSDGPSGNGSTISGATTARMVITGAQLADSATYRCEVTMGALTCFAGDQTVHIVQTPVLQAPQPNQLTYSVSEALTLPISATGFPSFWTINKLPSGMKFNSKTGVLSGTPNVSGDFLIKIKARNPAGTGEISFTLTVQPLPERVVGTYRGLIGRDPLGNANLGGALTLTVTKTGTYTVSLTRGAITHRKTERLATTAAANPLMPNPATGYVLLSKPGVTPTLTLSFTIDPNEGELTGSLVEGLNWMAFVEAWENPFSLSAPATEYEGTYNTAFLPPFGVVEGQQPQGCSYGRLIVSKTGAATWSGRLADGTSTSFSAAVGKTGKMPLHRLLYGNTGSYRGWLTVVEDAGSGYANNTISADLEWFKKQPQPATVRSYELGFTQSNITGLGAKWVKPVFPNIPLGLTTGAKVTFSKGGITSSQLVVAPADTLSYSFTFSDKISIVHNPVNPAKLTLTFSPVTGIYTGTANLSDGVPAVKRTLSYGGIMIGGPVNQSVGWFTLPKLPVPPEKSTDTDILSGLLELGPP